MPKPKKTETTPNPSPAPLPFSGGAPADAAEPPAWVETILAGIRSGVERLKGTIESQVARSGEAALHTEILQRLEAVASASRVAATSSELSALRGEVRALGVELREVVAGLRHATDQAVSYAQSADKYAAEVERRTRPVEPPEAEALSEPAPRLGVIGFLRALGRPEVQRGLGRLIQTAERLGSQDRLLPGEKPALSLPGNTD